MGKLRNLIINEIKKSIENENGLTGDEWKDNYFAPTDQKTIHVSKVDYLKLNDKDLLSFLNYLLLERDRASRCRIRNSENKLIKMGCVLDSCARPFADDCECCFHYMDLNKIKK